jgi:hypothetical protein
LRQDERVEYRLSADQVLLNDPFKHRGIALPIPGPVRIDESNRAAFAHPQAVGLGPKDTAPIGQTKLVQTPLEIGPRFKTANLVATLGRGLVTAEKNMPLGGVHTDRDGDASLTHSAALLGSWSRHALTWKEWNPMVGARRIARTR